MPRAPKLIKRKACRPKIPIDWNMVDKYLEAGCTGTEIASVIGCHYQTFYDRCELEKGMGFTEYSKLKRAVGDAILRAKQYAYAMTGKNGNLGMLIWLGKNRLGQKDDPITNVAFDGRLGKLLDGVKTAIDERKDGVSEDNASSKFKAD